MMQARFELTGQTYRYLFENASDAMWVHDMKGNIVDANKACEKFTGFTRQELLGKNIKEFLTGEFLSLAREVRRKLLCGEEIAQPYEQRLVRKEGTIGTMKMATSLVIIDGEPRGFQHVARDVTEEKSVEKMLSKIINGSPIPSFVINKQHKVTHWNKAIESLSSISEQEIVATDKQWQAFYAQKRPVMADLIADGASADEVDAYYRGKYKKSDLIDGAYEAEDFFPALGEYGKWLHFTASPIKNKGGEITGAVETLQDITERKRVEKALRESEKSFRDLFESAIDAIWVHDLDGNIQVANKATAKLTGYPLEEVCQANVSSFFTLESLNLARDIQAKLIHHQSVDMPYQQRLSRRDGTELIVELTTRLITQNDQPIAFQSIARDVTGEVKMQESMHFYLQKVLVAQEEERKRVARDLHDTAQSLLLLIRKLDTEISDPKNKLSKLVQEKVNRLRGLAMEILEGVRCYAQELRPAILDDLGLIAALEWMADNLIAENGIDADVQLDMLRCDLPREVQLVLFRIAQEALINIKRHAEASEVVIRLESQASKMRMIITDNGKGFEVPMQLNDLSSTGKLGLIGMQERAQLLNGIMSIQSELGKGTSIIIEIPLEK